MEKIVWEVKYSSPPETIHYCKKCGTKTEYRSSGLFRINAQQKSLDIWLIYRCIHCKDTWNLPIYSCINTKRISTDLLEKFAENDEELACLYAFDTTLLKQNGAETKAPAYSITGEAVDFNRHTRVEIISQYPSQIKISRIIREKMSLSAKSFDQMVSCGIIQLESGADIYKSKVRKSLTVQFRGNIAAGNSVTENSVADL